MVYTYDYPSNTTTLLASLPNSADIAITNDRLWVYNGNQIYEYGVALNPLRLTSLTPLRTITFSPETTVNGLVAKTNLKSRYTPRNTRTPRVRSRPLKRSAFARRGPRCKRRWTAAWRPRTPRNSWLIWPGLRPQRRQRPRSARESPAMMTTTCRISGDM